MFSSSCCVCYAYYLYLPSSCNARSRSSFDLANCSLALSNSYFNFIFSSTIYDLNFPISTSSLPILCNSSVCTSHFYFNSATKAASYDDACPSLLASLILIYPSETSSYSRLTWSLSYPIFPAMLSSSSSCSSLVSSIAFFTYLSCSDSLSIIFCFALSSVYAASSTYFFSRLASSACFLSSSILELEATAVASRFSRVPTSKFAFSASDFTY